MHRALCTCVVLALLGLTSGCHVCHGLKGGHCGGGHAGHCGHYGAGSAPSYAGAGWEGPTNPDEPLYPGHCGPPQRSGVLAKCEGHQQAQIVQEPIQQSAAAVTYPYYTNRGPRDFLVNNPRSIGR